MEEEFLASNVNQYDTNPINSEKGPLKAVALTYDEQSDAAPRITATGSGTVAEQILALAFAHGVRVREDADLVEILATLELDSVIPLEAFTAVAEILSYVYQANAMYGKSTRDTIEGEQ